MHLFPSLRVTFASLMAIVGLVPAALADPSDLLFTVRLDGATNVPTISVTNNSPNLDINLFQMTIGNTAFEFDGRDVTLTAPPGGTATRILPAGATQSDVLQIALSDFNPGETFTVKIDLDTDGQNDVVRNPNVFFNNGGTLSNNSRVTVFAGPATATRTLPDFRPNELVFRGPSRILNVTSRAESQSDDGAFVRGVKVFHEGILVSDDFDTLQVDAGHGDRIQIVAPQEVYKDINSNFLAGSTTDDPDLIKNEAEERFVALGMSVNNVAQTADPTNYDFEILGNTTVQVKWEHFYALTVEHDFTKTQSVEVIAGTPWAGPLASDAAGTPDPPVSKQWVARGSEPIVQIDGALVDNFSHPGLDIRFVVEGYRAYGPPNTLLTQQQNAVRIDPNGDPDTPPDGVDIRKSQTGTVGSYDSASGGTSTQITTIDPPDGDHGLVTGNLIEITGSGYGPYNGIHSIIRLDATRFSIPVPFVAGDGEPLARGTWRNVSYVRNFEFETVEQRQQVENFNMYGPGGVTYVWQIQYGVRSNADDPSRIGLGKVYEVLPDGTVADRTVVDGVSWFDPGAHVKVVSAAEEGGVDGLSLTGWVNGDGYYFASQGEIDPSNGLPTSGSPALVNGSPVAAWITNGPLGSYGYDIPNLQRPVRTLWRYGAGAIVVNVTIGKHLFEDYPQYAPLFVRAPEPIINAQPDPVAVAPDAAPPGAELMAEWDPVSGRMYPTIPGRFTVPWKPGLESQNAVEVRVIATLPADPLRQILGHYPHIQGAPAVALDPDPEDDFLFKSIKYTTAGATVDNEGNFVTERPGLSVLLFSQLQKVGRGEPKEFLKVRVVDTRAWNVDLAAVPKEVPVGSKILDPAVDRAGLGTGYLLDFTGRARYNPFVYDAGLLEGLAARDIYDMEVLRADSSSLVVVNKGALPGPVIPVNEHPGVPDDELPIIVWYDDPRLNDGLMWPWVSRIYQPVWPNPDRAAQIVIASQFGSEGLGRTGDEQETAPAIGDVPAATTYDPSRLQAVQIYQQPDPEAPGYNPNEEHALVAPSLRFADVSPRPPAIYALRDGDINYSNPNVTTGDTAYTSDPYVLVQFFDVAADEVKMNIYTVKRESSLGDQPFYRFADNFTATTTNLASQPYVVMNAGEPVIPFYPLGVAIGASPPQETFGNNFFPQETYWEDWRGTYWSISGGNRAWFDVSFYYPLGPDFWWPANVQVPPVRVQKSGATYTPVYDTNPDRGPAVPQTGDAVAFLPDMVRAPANSQVFLSSHLPTRVIYKSEWPDNPPVLKAGETLTFAGGENSADETFLGTSDPAPGLPQLTAFASAEVIFDSLNPESDPDLLRTNWTGRIVNALVKRTASLDIDNFPEELQPATGRTTVKGGKFVFNELSASLQRRLRYDPIVGQFEFIGLLNDKDIGDATLTAAPPQVYSLEPNIMTVDEWREISTLAGGDSSWTGAVSRLFIETRDPRLIANYFFNSRILEDLLEQHLAGLIPASGLPEFDPIFSYFTAQTPRPLRAYGPGLALIPNGGLLDPVGQLPDGSDFPDVSYITVVENNDPSLGGSPITPHIIKVDRSKRYRGSIQVLLSDNVFDENIVLRSTGDFGANADELVFEWWYRPDDGSLNVPPPDLIPAGQTNPWKLFPDPSGNGGQGRYQITLKGNPNAPETLLADSWWFVRYRHVNDSTSGTNWNVAQPDGSNGVNFTWAGAGNSQPLIDADLDGIKDYRAQLAQGWIKRVLDAVNPYEARIRDFEGDNPATISSMIAQFGPRYEGPVALNPDKNVIENVGLIELYETILQRGRSLSIDLSRPVSTPAIANALQLASTRISDFYSLLGNEAYGDALDPTIGHGSDSVDYGALSTSVFAFQNQMPSLIGEELSLLRGVDDFFARPVYNRLFWNFTKGEGEAAYATNYNINDITQDGFIDEDDAMTLFPQGHGDAWGHYLTAVRNQYELLRHPFFNWVSRSESYNLQDIVITVDFLDERKFADAAAAKAKAGAEIVSLTYRDRYVADPKAQWQGYTDSNPDRAWGVDEWSRRAGQGAYFDWVTSNALLPAEHPNSELEGIQKVDRTTNSSIRVVSANLAAVQRTVDQADRGYNPLGIVAGAQMFDLDPSFLEVGSGVQGETHFDQIYNRFTEMLDHATTTWDWANEGTQMLRRIGNSELDFRNSTFQEDLAYRNRLIEIFGKPYEGNIGPGKLYPAGYEGPDLGLYMYVPIREISYETVPRPSTSFASFGSSGALSGGDLYDAYLAANPSGSSDTIFNHETALKEVDVGIRELFNGTFANATNNLEYDSETTSGLFAVNYTDLDNQKVELENFINQMPITAAGYTFQSPPEWGARGATGELQILVNQMIQQEAEIAKAIAAWDALSGETVRILRLINARLTTSGLNQGNNEVFSRVKLGVNDTIKVIETASQVIKAAREVTWELKEATVEGTPLQLPTGGLAISPGDALSLARAGIEFTAVGTRAGLLTADNALAIGKLVAEIALDIAENELALAEADRNRELEIKEWIKELEDQVGDEAILRVAVFKEIQALRELSDRYRTLLDEGGRLVDERAAFNKRVAAQTQLNRYQDMTFRVSRNHALQTYRSSFDLAARYAYLAASAYDYETNYSLDDPASPADTYAEILKVRSLGELSRSLERLKQNYDSQRSQLGFNNSQVETGEISLRREFMRILPSGEAQPNLPANEYPSPGEDSDTVWQRQLEKARVDDLWQVAEFRNNCRPFAAATDVSGNQVPQPGLVISFSSDISTGKNFFGKPLSGGDQAYSTSNFATKITGVGVAFEGYQTDSIENDLAAAPRIYFVPAGIDIMRVSRSDDPNALRSWKVVEQAIPVPFPGSNSAIENSGFIPLIDALNGQLGDERRFADFRAYPEELGDAIKDTRLVGRSVWNTRWVLIIPGATLNADPEVGLDRFVDQVSDIKLIFDTYGQSGG